MNNNINDEILRNFGGTVLNDLNLLMDTGDDSAHEISTESYSPYMTSEKFLSILKMTKTFVS